MTQPPDKSVTADRAAELLRLHQEPELLTVVNVWDVVSARAVAATPGTKALATASHSIAATFGYPDGEQIPVDLMLEMVGRIVADSDLPVTADLEGGYGDAAETVRKAIGLGVVGCQHRGPDEAVVGGGRPGGGDHARGRRGGRRLRPQRPHRRVRARSRPGPADVLADAVERGRAFLDAGAPVVFVPALLSEEQVATLVDAFGPQRLTCIGIPGGPSLARLEELGVARVSYGPMPQRVALTALQELVEEIHRGGEVPSNMRTLN